MKIASLAALVVCAIGLPVAATAQVPGGRYQIGACTTQPSDTQIVIAGNVIGFWESRCALSNPVPVRDMAGAVLYDAACMGEGTTWTRRYLLMPGYGGGLVLVGEGFASEYAYCGP
jgi:hypothetical protein